MTGFESARTAFETDADKAAPARSALRVRVSLALTVLAACMALGLAASGGAAAGSDDICPLGYYEVDDDYPAPNIVACQYQSLVQISALPLTPTDVIFVHNGAYNNTWWNITTNGLTVIGESGRGVWVNGTSFVNAPIAVRAWDTNLTNLILRGATYALEVDISQTQSNRTALTNITLQGSPSWACVCYGANMRIRNMVVYGVGLGFLSGGRGLDLDGLQVNTTGSSSIKFYAYGPDVRIVNATLWGSLSSYGLYLESSNSNFTLSRVSVENTTFGIYAQGWPGDIRANNLSIQNSYYGIYVELDGVVELHDVTVVNSSANAIFGSYSVYPFNITRASLVGCGGSCFEWTGGQAVNMRDTVIRNSGDDGVHFTVAYPFWAQNLTIDNVSQSGVYSTTSVNVTGGLVNNTHTGFYLDSSSTKTHLSNLSITNTQDAAVFLARDNRDVRLQNLSILNARNGIYANSLTGALIEGNRVENVSQFGFFLETRYSRVYNNTAVNAPNGFDFRIYASTAADFTYNDVPTSNTLDGKPIIYIHNQTGVQVPANANTIWIFNSTGVTISGVNQTAGPLGIFLSAVKNVSINNSWLIGNVTNGLWAFKSSNVTIDNVTILGWQWQDSVRLESVTNAWLTNVTVFRPVMSSDAFVLLSPVNVSIAGAVALNASTCYAVYNFQNVSLTRAAGTCSNFGIYAETGSGLNISQFFKPLGGGNGLYFRGVNGFNVSDSAVLDVDGTGVELSSGNRGTFFNTTVTSLYSAGIWVDSFSNLTIRNSTFVSEGFWGLYAYLSVDLRTYNSTYVSRIDWAFVLDVGSLRAVMVHNNFYGFGLYDGNGYGTWDGGWPAGGNYYNWAAGAFLDNATGPAQNLAGTKDGIKDAPAYPIGGTRNDNYALMDPWPPKVALTSPQDGSLIKAGTALNFSISNFFDSATWQDDTGGGATTFAYPHDINTTGWADGWHNITIVATDPSIMDATLKAPSVTVTFSFEFDSTGPVFDATPTLGFPAIQQGPPIDIRVLDPHLNASYYILDGTPFNLTPPWSVATAALSQGAHTLTLFANDTLNNSRTFVWTFYIDALSPTLTRTAPAGDDYFQPGTAIGYDAADDFNLTSVVYTATLFGNTSSVSGNVTPVGPSWEIDTSAIPDGCYDLVVYASDEAGHVTSDRWTFCLDNANPDLTAFLGGFGTAEDVDFTFDGGLVVELDDAPAFEWTFDDTVLLALTTLTGRYPVHVFDTPGSYNVHLKVTDRADNFDELDFTLTVDDTTAPVADFVLDATYPEDLPITLDASPSFDNDGYWNGGATGFFSWEILGANFSLYIDGRQVDVTLSEPGLYTVTLWVWDETGNGHTVSFDTEILDTTPPTIVVSGGRGPFNEGHTVVLDASGSSDNDVGFPLVFSWRFTYNSAQQSISGPLLNFTFQAPSTYTITLHVFDRSGLENTTQVFVRINDVPAITGTPITTVSAGAGYEWAAEKQDGDLADTWTWSLVAGPAGMSISQAGIVAWQTAADSYGIYNVGIRLTDGIGTVDFAYVLTVMRSANAANHAPFFSSFPVQSGLPGTSYAYTVGFGDPDAGDRVTLAVLEAPDGMVLDAQNVLRWAIPTTGSGVTYTVSLAVFDGLEMVWQNFTIRARPNDAAPVFAAGKVPTTATVAVGGTFTLILDATFASDLDDAFDLLSFFATAADGTALEVSLTKSGTQWTLTITGLKAGTSRVTLRVADQSGLNAEAPIDVTVTAAAVTTPEGGFPLMLLLLAALGGAGVVAIVVMRRRKKDEGEVPVQAPPAAPAARAAPKPPAVAAPAEVVQVDVIQAVASVAVPVAALGAAAGAAVAAAAVSPKPKSATYLVEGLFVIYQDGRMIYTKTDIGRESLGDPELVSSMFTAVQQFIKDSFSAEGELNKMGYGENQILIERGKTVFMATINFGEPDKELQETMQAAIEKMEYAYAGIIEAWDGQQNRFADVDKYCAPVLALTAGITRQDVLAATTTRDVKVLSQLEFFQGFVRLKVGIKNDTEAVITKVTLDIDFNEDVLRLQRIEPASYKTSGARVMLNVLNPGEKSSVAFYFDPQICTETNIDGIVRFRDYKGVLSSVTMKTRKAEVVCPLFFTKEHANTAMLKRLIENELQEKDSKIYTITKLPPYVKYKDIFDVAKGVVLSHDVHMVREFVSYNPFSGEAWFYGETKVKNYKIVIRAAVREDNTIEFFAASTVIKAVTGLLAEFNHTLVSMIVERYSDVKIEQIYDEATKHQIQSKALIDKLGEGEAGAGETEQPR